MNNNEESIKEMRDIEKKGKEHKKKELKKEHGAEAGEDGGNYKASDEYSVFSIFGSVNFVLLIPLTYEDLNI